MAPQVAQPLPPAAPAGIEMLADGPYFMVSMQLDAIELCRSDATCKLVRTLNCASGGPWRALGARTFYGVELERDGVFDAADGRSGDEADEKLSAVGSRKHMRVDWKNRFRRFHDEAPMFRAPFNGSAITCVKNPDEVAYCRCRLRADLLSSSSSSGSSGVYLEVEVSSNPDNLSLAVVDFEEAGGRSSVTFSPDTGAVIRERKVRESPRKVEGAYVQPLSTSPAGRRFEGSMGLLLQGGRLAFFRRCVVADEGGETKVGPWESTGFIADLAWAEGRRLTPCLAFRDEGAYCVRVVRVCNQPPQVHQKLETTHDDASWSGLDWEAGRTPATEGP